MTEKLLRFNLCFLGLLLLTFTTAFSFGQVQPQVIVPPFDDDFCKTVQQLENGQTDIDYLAYSIPSSKMATAKLVLLPGP